MTYHQAFMLVPFCVGNLKIQVNTKSYFIFVAFLHSAVAFKCVSLSLVKCYNANLRLNNYETKNNNTVVIRGYRYFKCIP